ncbi:Nicotinamide N-methyltransferase-like protein [Corchorus olitorius]|uniref:Nicotinamide N-methyltransferase-like protein n=1 Tax=Corchorus olitorius TaxID=93759 RepID=A0A1R3JW69_9ROSI|nr:Nicotinamide N-methyltransferase-like protein [Corchorus olitorius]
MAEQELEPTASPGIHLVGKGNKSYLQKFVKKLITEIESNHGNVLDEIYEQYASYMTSLKDTNMVKENERVCKCISFLFPGDCIELSSCPTSRKLLIPLQCSLNMLEGDTGCSIWPSSLFLSELILSYPHIFSGKSCFEVGSGVGLIGICLSHIKASEVILSDGDSSTLANMKLNLEMNHLNTETDLPEISTENSNLVKCIHLPWESASEKELNELMPEIILGADVIYNPSCLPHLVQLLAILLNKKKSCDKNFKGSPQNYLPELTSVDGKVTNASQGQVINADAYEFNTNDATSTSLGSREDPVAYIASVIRNIDTFNHFLSLADQADLTITDLTGMLKPFDLLPYMRSYDRSSIRLLTISSK